MKIYPLRMDDSLMEALKGTALREKKSVRAIILDAIIHKMSQYSNTTHNLRDRRELARAACLARRLTGDKILAAIHEGHKR